MTSQASKDPNLTPPVFWARGIEVSFLSLKELKRPRVIVGGDETSGTSALAGREATKSGSALPRCREQLTAYGLA